jgi:hypothetical protein
VRGHRSAGLSVFLHQDCINQITGRMGPTAMAGPSWLAPSLHADPFTLLCLIRKRFSAQRLRSMLLLICVAAFSPALQRWLMRAMDTWRSQWQRVQQPAGNQHTVSSTASIAYVSQFCISFQQAYQKHRRLREACEHQALTRINMPRLPSIEESINEAAEVSSKA